MNINNKEDIMEGVTTITKWERIDRHTDRLKVPGGWIVRSRIIYEGCSVHHIFIEDQKHTWKLEK